VVQYYRLGELGFLKDKRVELIRGEILEMSPINWLHMAGTTKVGDVLRVVFAGKAWISIQNPLAMSDSAPVPDVCVFRGQMGDYSNIPTMAELVVEVSDTTLFYDTTTKAELYATAGIQDYWVLDLEGKRLLVFRDPVTLPAGLGATAYRTHLVLGSTEAISPLVAAAHTIRVSDLLP
jgi:Uma2 family endonuclease